ncbi:tetratricopeptide repeat protein [Streptomyces sp. NPDC059680]|uniref:tetratricopeptide repeat protein n=1 Tax=Streptomyces sp. NPDC059680 TaxID=3346904 RepID=UPI0036ABFABE
MRAKTVVWLNEAQHYLGDPEIGEYIAAQIHDLLSRRDRGPVLVLGTLWPEYAHQYSAVPEGSRTDPHSRTRELLAGRVITIPDTFDTQALAEAAALAQRGDWLLADALTRASEHGRLAQDLAGAPELLIRYQSGSPAARAVLEAAMDARRLGVGLNIPQAFLTDAVTDYLTDHDYENLTEDWAEQTYAELARPVHGKLAPLRRTNRRPTRPSTSAQKTKPDPAPVTGPVFRLADYLEQHGRDIRRLLCPPASFWHAAYTHLTAPDDLGKLATAAHLRHRLWWADQLRQRAADVGNVDALLYVAAYRQDAGDLEGAAAAYRRAAEAGGTRALFRLALMWEAAGDLESAEAVYRQATESGEGDPLTKLATLRQRHGDLEGAEAILRQAADRGESEAFLLLVQMLEKAGDLKGAEAACRQYVGEDGTDRMLLLAEMREMAGELERAEAIYLQAADAGDTRATLHLAQMWEMHAQPERAMPGYRKLADAGEALAFSGLARVHERAGDREGAVVHYRRAADAGDTSALLSLARMCHEAGDLDGAESLYREAADCGDTAALFSLGMMREEAGELVAAEATYRHCLASGDTDALQYLARMRERSGDLPAAEALYKQAADAGSADEPWMFDVGDRQGCPRQRWRYGLDPEGKPTPPW